MQEKAAKIVEGLEYIDFTDDFESLMKEMTLGEMINSDTFSLYDSMSGTELGDPKMDIKQGLNEAETPDSMLKDGKIKLANELSPQEMTGVLDEFLVQSMIWMEGHSLAHSIYQIGYIFDDKLYKDNKILKTFIDTLFYFGNNCFDLCRYSHYLREDDYVISIFSFPQENKKFSEIEEQFNECDEEFSGKITNAKKKKTKKNLKLNEYDALYCRFQLQKIIFEITEILCEQKLTNEIIENLEKKIKKGRALLDEVVKTIELSADMSSIRSKSIYKTLVAQISPRKYVERTKEQGYAMLGNIFDQLERISEIYHQDSIQNVTRMLDSFHELPKNVVLKAFLDVTLIQNQSEFFGKVQLPDFIQKEFSLLGLTNDQIKSDLVQVHLRRLTIVQLEYLLKHLKNKYRQHREFPKMHQDLSIIIHEASQLDNDMFQNKPMQNQVLVVQTYDMGIKLMIKQVALGNYLELYDQADQPQALFYMDYLHSILEKNQLNFIQKFDREFLQAYNNKSPLEKTKKKLSDYQRTYFFTFIFNKGLQFYLKAMSRLSFFILNKGCIQNFNNEEEYKNRFENRFDKLFQHVYYIKKLDYNQYVEFQQDFWNNYPEEAGLDKLKDIFKEAQEQFALIPQNDTVIPEELKQDAKKLERICVISSLTNLTLKMKFKEIESQKFSFSYENHRLYPVIQLSK